MGDRRYEIRRWHAEEAEMEMKECQADASMVDARQMGHITQTGAWISVLPFTINVTELRAQEWRESLFLPYGIDPYDLPEHCNECGMEFKICHALDFQKGGLITARHNGICDGVFDLASKSFTPTHLCDDPNIYTGRTMSGRKDKVKGYPS